MLHLSDFKLEIKTSLFLIAGFIIFTVIGTVSHELGHYCVAKYFGFDARLSYNYTFWTNNGTARENFLIALGGPLQTMVTGTIGLLLLLPGSIRSADPFSFKQWTILFIPLFWLRELFNLFLWILKGIVTGVFSNTTDEIKLADYLGLPDWTFITLFGIIGALVLLFIIMKIIPAQQRFTFIFSGIIGAALGFVVWMLWLGPILLPYPDL